MEDIDIYYYWIMIKRRWKLVAAIVSAMLALAITYILMTPPLYEATTTIIFPPQINQGNSLLAQFTGVQSILGGSTSYAPATYSNILKSRRLARAVGKRLELDKMGVGIDGLNNYLNVATPRDGGLEITCSVPTKWFKGQSKAVARSKAAATSASMANAYAKELEIYDKSNAFTANRKNRVFLELELAKTKEKLVKAEDQFKEFREKNPSVLPVDQSDAEIKTLVDLRARQLETQASLEETEKRIGSSTDVLSKEEREILSARVMSNNPVLAGLSEKLAELEIKKATLLENVTEKHPDVVSIDQEIAQTKRMMAGDLEARILSSQTLSINPVYQSLQSQVVGQVVERAGLSARLSALNTIMQKAEQEMTDSASKQMEYVRLVRDLKALEMVYTTMLGEYSKAQINESRESDNFKVLDWAEAPDVPIKPRPKLSLAIAVLVGLVLGCTLAIVVESTSIRKKKAGNSSKQ